MMVHTTAFMFLAYFSGSVPCGLVLTRLFTQSDILRAGSGNIGANNVRRLAGNTLGLLTLLADMAKGGIPVYLAGSWARPYGKWYGGVVCITAAAAFLGHLYPLYMRGRNGGKGVATAAGCFIAIAPLVVGCALLVYTLVVCITRRSSAASMTASVFLPFAVYVADASRFVVLCAGFMAVMIVIRHKDNLQRLIRGEEPALF